MAAKTSAISLLLAISLVSLCTTEMVEATFINPLSIPSCTANHAMLKCAHDVKAAVTGGTGSARIGAGPHTVSLLLEFITTAEASYANVLHFLSSNHIKSNLGTSVHSAIRIAIQELSQASKLLHGKTTLSSSELHEVQNLLTIANQSLMKSIACLKNSNGHGNISLSLRTLIDQSISLTALSLKILGRLCGKVAVGLIH